MPLFGNEKRKYQREWIAERRTEGIAYLGGKCAHCGSSRNLQVDHKDSLEKISHKIWSWAEARRKKELDKCQLLCESCHKKKTLERKEQARGSKSGPAKLDESSVKEIRDKFASGNITKRQLARDYGVDEKAIRALIARETWQHVK